MGCTRKILRVPNKDEKLYQEVSHIRVEGSDKEIGEQLAKLGKEYKVTFARYEDEHFAEGRRRFFKRNWPSMWQRIEGVAKAHGADANKRAELRDFSALVYDMSPSSRMRGPGCSAVSFANSHSGGPLVARNFDAWELLPDEIFDDPDKKLDAADNRSNAKKKDPYPHLYSRPFVMETVSTDRDNGKDIHKVIAVGGHDLLCPFQDALNDKGLFVTTLADRVPPLTEHMAMAGGRNAGLSSRHIMLLLASRCANVAETKSEVLSFQPRMDFGLQWLIADAQGQATVLAIDEHGCFIFSDRHGSRPLIVTNHPLYEEGRDEYFRDRPPRPSQHYDTFNRYARIEGAIDTHPDPYRIEEAEALMDCVAAAYRVPKLAGTASTQTFTAWSLVADLKNRKLHIRFNRGLGAPRPANPQANHLNIIWQAEEFGFDTGP